MNERVPLSFLLVQHKDEDPPVVPVVPFPAIFGEDPKIVTAVLENTVVLASTNDKYERIAKRHDQVLVDPAVIEWRTKTAGYEGERIHADQRGKPGAKFRNYEAITERRRQRQQTDQRAIESQQQVAAAKTRELQHDLAISRKETTSMPDVLKHCPNCKQDKPKSEFPPGKGAFYCNECRATKAADGSQDIKINNAPSERPAAPTRRGRIVDGHVVQAAEGKKFCPHCKTEKPLTDYGLNKAKADGHQSVCKECRSKGWSAGSTALGHQKKAKGGDAGAQLKVLVGGLRTLIRDLRAENEELKAQLVGVNAQLEELLA